MHQKRIWTKFSELIGWIMKPFSYCGRMSYIHRSRVEHLEHLQTEFNPILESRRCNISSLSVSVTNYHTITLRITLSENPTSTVELFLHPSTPHRPSYIVEELDDISIQICSHTMCEILFLRHKKNWINPKLLVPFEAILFINNLG